MAMTINFQYLFGNMFQKIQITQQISLVKKEQQSEHF